MRAFRNLKQALRARRNSPNPIVRHGIASMRAAYQGILVGKTFCTDATYRSIVLLKLLRAPSLHQTTTVTGMDRYPAIFSACREYFGDKRDLKILSFGCSTGEEVLTLRHYFPSAFITGAEINRRSHSQCRKRTVDDRIAFVCSSRDAIRAHGPFDDASVAPKYKPLEGAEQQGDDMPKFDRNSLRVETAASGSVFVKIRG